LKSLELLFDHQWLALALSQFSSSASLNSTVHTLNFLSLQCSTIAGFKPLSFPLNWLITKLVFLCIFTFTTKEILAKRKLNLCVPRFEPTTMPMPSQCTTYSTNSCIVIIPIILGLYYHSSWSSTLLLE